MLRFEVCRESTGEVIAICTSRKSAEDIADRLSQRINEEYESLQRVVVLSKGKAVYKSDDSEARRACPFWLKRALRRLEYYQQNLVD